jgi:cytochrome c oxidase assembly protein subunit 15
MAQTASQLMPETAVRNGRMAAIRWWLVAVAVLVFAIVLLGGATRLTDSGLSITEWQPIMGAIPPLNEADWTDAFAKYRQIPEYQRINAGMSLDEFKTIFWWEWSHRFMGRAIGIVFFVPFMAFWLSGWLSRRLTWRLAGILLLGALQGVMGWYMVMSGLVDRVDVSQYRLAAHLALAAVIFAALIWTVLRLGEGDRADSGRSNSPGLVLSAAALVGLIFLQIVAGAFVAGIDAGLVNNTWPLMDGRIIPSGLNAMAPWYINLFENALTVQFDHRMIAYLIVFWALFHCAAAAVKTGQGSVTWGAAVLAAAIVAQAVSGIWTLLGAVPLDRAMMHQAGAFLVFALVLVHLHTVLTRPA